MRLFITYVGVMLAIFFVYIYLTSPDCTRVGSAEELSQARAARGEGALDMYLAQAKPVGNFLKNKREYFEERGQVFMCATRLSRINPFD